MIRDLRSVFASIEKQHRKNPLLDDSQAPVGKTLWSRADHMFGPDGIVGGPITGVEDLIRRQESDNVLFVIYEDLSINPEKTMRQIYDFIGEKHFFHDFKDIKNTAIDPDNIYLNKFPHKGCGAVMPTNIDEWKDYFSEEMARTIMDRFPLYNGFFGYKA